MTFVSIRGISYTQIGNAAKENVAHMSDRVADIISSHVDLLEHTVIGAIPYMRSERVDRDTLSLYFDDMQATLANVLMIYCTNNVRWNAPGGYCASSTGWIPAPSWNNLERSWYNDAKKAMGKVAFTMPYIDAATGKLIFAMARTVYDKNGRDLGVVSENVSIASLGAMLAENTTIPGQETWLITKDGLFITNSDEDSIMKKDFFAEWDSAGTKGELEKYRSAVLSSDSFSGMDSNVFISSSLIPQSGWILVSTLPSEVIFESANALLIRTLITGIALLLAAALASIALSGIVVKPLRYLAAYSNVIAGGDFSGSAPDYGTAEAAGLSAGFNAINENISGLVKNINNSFERMRSNNAGLKEVMGKSSSAASEIVRLVREVEVQVNEEAALVGQTVAQIDDKIASLNKLIQEQAAQISHSSGSIETMIKHNQEIEYQIVSLNDQISRLVESSNTEHEQIAQSTAAVEQIGKASETLAGMNKIISNVAAETNLLAMNAAIEAAHAGESGKGFAVVSGEIRKLAETSTTQAKSSSGTLSQIKKRIDEVTAVSGRIENAYAQTSGLIMESSKIVSRIKTAIADQSARSEQVLDGLKKVQAMTQDVEQEAVSIKEETDASRRISQKLADMSGKIQLKVGDVARSTEFVSEASKQANEAVERNTGGLNALDNAIKRFKVRNSGA
jgi:methyl-accepting chemotaxis protein